jgi:CRISPR-associated endonuclease/helicase Cas3
VAASPRAVLWRGGLDDEASIAMRDPLDPAAVAIVVSTVDQVGSRLLFRGYGMSSGSRALHAGLLGVDTAVVLDEAHIAAPFLETVATIAARQRAAPRPPRPPLHICPISATHETTGFELTSAERAEPAIATRLTASKAATLAHGRDAKTVLELARELAQGGAKVIGVVVNTVADAREMFDVLAALAPRPMVDRVLLIGPTRPLDRLDLVAAIPDREQRAACETPFVVVATQTIEVGIDLDVDALVTACAPLDALVQRFGRLDRAGALGNSRAAVLAPPRSCPVYGESTAGTWQWLAHVAIDGVVDFGIEALAATIDAAGMPDPAEPVRTIALLDDHIKALEVTDGLDDEGPSVDLLLHGDRRPSSDVAVVWRDVHGDEELARDLELRPLHPSEVLTVSLAAMRRWLSGQRGGDQVADVEALGAGPADQPPQRASRPRAWRISPDGELVSVTGGAVLRPVDRIVVACSSGGLDEFGWAPSSTAKVMDHGALSLRASRLVLRAGDPDVDAVAEELLSGEITAAEGAAALSARISAGLPAASEVRPLRSARIEQVRERLVGGRAFAQPDGGILIAARDVRSQFGGSGALIALNDHQAAVCERVLWLLQRVGIDGHERTSLIRAASGHDEGKRDHRFQEWLRGGKAVPFDLAKSAYPFERARVRRLRETAGWPGGKRHELVSAAALATRFHDDTLARWLVATHHGHNRPFPAGVDDPADHVVSTFADGQPVEIRCGAHPSVADQLDALIVLSSSYGPWGLAFLEALLISADRTVSAQEQTQ